MPPPPEGVPVLGTGIFRPVRPPSVDPRRRASESVCKSGYGDVRDPHLQIFGNIRMGGIRLTQLATRAQLSLAATSELVNDLESLGYLRRRPDPTDGRAKLIELTARGQALQSDTGTRVANIEQRRASMVGKHQFADMCTTMQRLLDGFEGLDTDDARR